MLDDRNRLGRLPQIYEEFYHTINNADQEKDVKWWSNNFGVNMAMNWPQFEVTNPTGSCSRVATRSAREMSVVSRFFC